MALEQHPGHATPCARILEELLMNARKQAPGAPIAVDVERNSEGLSLRVRNPFTSAPDAPPVGTGLGLVGVKERARLLGGDAHFGPTAAGTFEVEVSMP